MSEELQRKRKPLIDDSPDEMEHSLEDDFNELIRRELADDAPKEIKVEPAKEVPKVEISDEKRDAPKQEPKRVPKDVPKPEPKRAPVARAPPKKVAERVQPKKVESKPEPKKVERNEPKRDPRAHPKRHVEPAKKETPPQAPAPVNGPRTGRWFSLMVLLLIAVGAVYAVSALRNSKDAGALGCAAAYVQDHSGVSLLWADANAVERYWLRQAFETSSGQEAAVIFHMLACDEAFLSTLSDPAAYVDCVTPPVYVVVDSATLSENPVAALGAETVLAQLVAGKSLRQFKLAYALEEPGVSAWEVTVDAPPKAPAKKA